MDFDETVPDTAEMSDEELKETIDRLEVGEPIPTPTPDDPDATAPTPVFSDPSPSPAPSRS